MIEFSYFVKIYLFHTLKCFLYIQFSNSVLMCCNWNLFCLSLRNSYCSWLKLMQGHDMCNVDVGFHAQKEEHVLTCVLETTWGCLYWQGALGSKGNAQQLKGEAAAMLEAMKELEQRGFTNVVFETDSKNVADAIHTQD
jgi:hypothetical protein